MCIIGIMRGILTLPPVVYFHLNHKYCSSKLEQPAPSVNTTQRLDTAHLQVLRIALPVIRAPMQVMPGYIDDVCMSHTMLHQMCGFWFQAQPRQSAGHTQS